MKSVCIIIPTRERAHTLKYTIKTCLNQEYRNLRVLVCDNYSSDNTKEVVSSFKDSRLDYINPGKRLSMSENWEFAMNNCHEDLVTIIGDDDGFLPNSIDQATTILEKHREKPMFLSIRPI